MTTRYFEAASLKAESGLAVLERNASAGKGVEFGAPAAFRIATTSEREAARVAGQFFLGLRHFGTISSAWTIATI